MFGWCPHLIFKAYFFRISITLICTHMQDLYSFGVNFEGALMAIDICPLDPRLRSSDKIIGF